MWALVGTRLEEPTRSTHLKGLSGPGRGGGPVAIYRDSGVVPAVVGGPGATRTRVPREGLTWTRPSRQWPNLNRRGCVGANLSYVVRSPGRNKGLNQRV